MLVCVLCLTVVAAFFSGCEDTDVNSYKITYDSNGGTEISVSEGVVVTEPTPQKDGYVLKGWYADAEFNGDRIVFPYTPVADCTLYAKWEKEELPPDDDLGDYKQFGSFAKDIEWVKGKDGNVILTKGSISTHDSEGNPVKLTEYEIRELISGATAKYTYTDIYGAEVTSSKGVDVLKTNGLDLTVYDTPQTVRMVTSLADGGSITSLLNMASIAGIDISIPGAVLTTQITVYSVKSVEFYQPEEVDNGKGEMVSNNPYDESKVYKYGDMLNPQFIAKLTFADDSIREVSVEPSFTDNPLSGTGKNAKIAYFGSFDMNYNAFGQTFTKHVNMADQFIPSDKIEVSMKTGEQYFVSKNMDIKYNTLDEEGSVKEITVYGKTDIMNQIDVEGVTVEVTSSGINISFDKEGVYEIRVKNSQNIYQDYVFTVSENKVCPGYTAIVIQDLDNAGLFKVEVSRTDQYGEGIKADVKIELANAEGEIATLTKDDYYLYTLVGEEEVKIDSLFLDKFLIAGYTFYIKVTNPDYIPENVVDTPGKITLYAPDCDNSVIMESELDRRDAYSIKLGDSLIQSTTSSYPGILIPIVPVCVEGMEIDSIKFTHEIKLTVGEEEIVLNTSDYKFNSIKDDGSVTTGLFKFTADGKYLSRDMCIRIVNDEIIGKINAQESAQVSYLVKATSDYGNFDLTSVVATLAVPQA